MFTIFHSKIISILFNIMWPKIKNIKDIKNKINEKINFNEKYFNII